MGELDLSAVPSLRSATSEALRDGWTDLIIDLEEVAFVDSAGLGVLIGLRRRVHERDGSLTLRVNEKVARLVTAAELDSLFTIEKVRIET